MNYGFIGCGNMAGAIINGCLKSGALQRENIYFFDKNEMLADKAEARFGIIKCAGLQEVAAVSDVLFLAVKPAQLPDVFELITNQIINKKPLIISIVASAELKYFTGVFGDENKIPVIRIMPNMNIDVCEGMAGICCNDHVTTGQKELVIKMFNQTGRAIEIEESQFQIFAAIAGCAPAFTYLYIDSLAKGAQKLGMNKKQALAIAAQTVLGSAKMLSESGEHPWELIDKVCTPGGSTIEGICTLESNCFESAVVSAVVASATKWK